MHALCEFLWFFIEMWLPGLDSHVVLEYVHLCLQACNTQRWRCVKENVFITLTSHWGTHHFPHITSTHSHLHTHQCSSQLQIFLWREMMKGGPLFMRRGGCSWEGEKKWQYSSLDNLGSSNIQANETWDFCLGSEISVSSVVLDGGDSQTIHIYVWGWLCTCYLLHYGSDGTSDFHQIEQTIGVEIQLQ